MGSLRRICREAGSGRACNSVATQVASEAGKPSLNAVADVRSVGERSTEAERPALQGGYHLVQQLLPVQVFR
jgi:hypothetical protein